MKYKTADENELDGNVIAFRPLILLKAKPCNESFLASSRKFEIPNGTLKMIKSLWDKRLRKFISNIIITSDHLVGLVQERFQNESLAINSISEVADLRCEISTRRSTSCFFSFRFFLSY